MIGDYTITVSCCGPRSEHQPKDAESMAASYIAQLKGAGHTVKTATIAPAGHAPEPFPLEPAPAIR